MSGEIAVGAGTTKVTFKDGSSVQVRQIPRHKRNECMALAGLHNPIDQTAIAKTNVFQARYAIVSCSGLKDVVTGAEQPFKTEHVPPLGTIAAVEVVDAIRDDEDLVRVCRVANGELDAEQAKN